VVVVAAVVAVAECEVVAAAVLAVVVCPHLA
jgi:hypothetical protein